MAPSPPQIRQLATCRPTEKSSVLALASPVRPMAPTAGRLHKMSAPYFATDQGVSSAHAASSPLKMANAPAPDVDTRIKSSATFRLGCAGGMLINIAEHMPGKRPLSQEN